MNVAIAALLATIPNAFIFVFSKIFTEAFMQIVIEKVTLYVLGKAVKMTTNTLDDEIFAEVQKRLQDSNGGGNV